MPPKNWGIDESFGSTDNHLRWGHSEGLKEGMREGFGERDATAAAEAEAERG